MLKHNDNHHLNLKKKIIPKLTSPDSGRYNVGASSIDSFLKPRLN